MLNDGDIKVIEANIGYSFSDKSLLITALTHSSYTYEHGGENNERLEFLGDSILNFLVAERLYFDNMSNEGVMTVVRSKLVSRTPLANAVDKLKLMDYLQIGGSLKKSDLSIKAKSNIFESVLAAIYLDSGLEQCKKFIFANISHENIFNVDYKSHLQEYLQAQRKKSTLLYKVETTSDGLFKAKAFLDGNEMGVGAGKRKKEAEQQAAKQLCLKLKII